MSIQTESSHVSEANQDMVSRLRDTFTNPDLRAVCWFAAIGLLLTIVLARAFPISEVASLIALAD